MDVVRYAGTVSYLKIQATYCGLSGTDGVSWIAFARTNLSNTTSEALRQEWNLNVIKASPEEPLIDQQRPLNTK